MVKSRAKLYCEKVIKYILTRSDEQLGNLTIQKITKELNISQSYLYQVFKEEKKITPAKFLTMIKMFRSAALLEEKINLPIRSISHRLGFANPDYFIRIFRKHFGTTPGKYRGYKHKK